MSRKIIQKGPDEAVSPLLDEQSAPSKTQVKAAMQDLQALGEELVGLSSGQLKKITLPDEILQAVLDCQKITAHGGRRRQLQYVGKLMRHVDDAPIRDGLAALRGESSTETAKMHRLETLRQRFLADENILQDIVDLYPAADTQQLRQLRRNALKETENQKPPKHFRALFQALKALEGNALTQESADR